jgi:hypothetical protein
MPFGKYILIPIFIAFQAFTLMAIAPFFPGTPAVMGAGLVTWISFQAWAMYFLAGCTPKMGVKTGVGYLGGIVASVAIFELAGVFAGLNSGTTPWGLYLAVFIVVVFVISAEKVPGIDFVPSYFLGAGVFFALMTYLGGKKPEGITQFEWYGRFALPEMIACVVGLAYGWWTVTVKTWYVAKVTATAPAPDARADAAKG